MIPYEFKVSGGIPTNGYAVVFDSVASEKHSWAHLATFAEMQAGDVATLASANSYTDAQVVGVVSAAAEVAQDAIGAALVDSASVDFTYTDAANQLTAVVLPAGVDHNSLANLAVGDVHPQYLLATGARAVTGQERFTFSGGPAPDLTRFAIVVQPSGSQPNYGSFAFALNGATTPTTYFDATGKLFAPDISVTAGDPFTQYAFLAGRAGGQTFNGGTGAGEILQLHSTSNATKGQIRLGGSFAYDGALGFVGLGTLLPLARVHAGATTGVSAVAWSTFGINWRVDDNSYTDTSGAGTVASNAVNVIGQPTLIASNVGVTYTSASTLYIKGPPLAGTNVSALTNPWALNVNTGAVRFGGYLNLGSTSAPLAVLTMDPSNTVLVGASGNNGCVIRQTTRTLTDPTSSGTVGGGMHANAFMPMAFAASNTVTFSMASTVYINGPPTAGANTTITAPLALLVNAGDTYLTGRLAISGATFTPSARIQLGGNLTAAAWTTSGIGLRYDAATYTDSSSSGTVTNATVYAFATPILAASASVTYTSAATLYVSGPPTAGTNVTITNPYVAILGGNTRIDGKLSVGSTVHAPTATLHLNGASTQAAWTINGVVLRIDAATYTDSSSSGTVSDQYASVFPVPSFAASSATTYTRAATVYINGPPAAGTNVTITSALCLYINGMTRTDGRIGVSVSPAALLHVAGGLSAVAWTTNGIRNRSDAATFTDTSSSSTVASIAVDSFSVPTLAASNAGVTYTDATTVYIAGNPTPGTNVTLTNPWGLWNLGATRLDGKIRVGGSAGVSGAVNALDIKTADQTPLALVLWNATFNATSAKGFSLWQGNTGQTGIFNNNVQVGWFGLNQNMRIGSISLPATTVTFQADAAGTNTCILANNSNNATGAIATMLSLQVLCTGAPAAGFGAKQDVQLQTSNNTLRLASYQQTQWVVATDAAQTGRWSLYVTDFGSLTGREAIRVETSGTASMIGFLGGAAVLRQVLAAAASDAATTQALVNSIRTAMINLGLGV